MGGFGSGVGIVDYRVLWRLLEQPTCRRPVYLPAGTGGEGTWEIALGLRA